MELEFLLSAEFPLDLLMRLNSSIVNVEDSFGISGFLWWKRS